MELLEFQNNLNRKWQKKIQKSCWIAFLIILCVELVVFFSYLGFGAIEEGGILSYLFIRIVLPSGLNFITLCATKWFIHSEKFTVENKNYAVCINILIICAITAAVHNYYYVIWMAPSVALFYSTLFNNYRVLTATYIGTILSSLLSMTVNIIDGEFGVLINVIYCIIAIGIFSVAYYISRVIIKHHIMQLEYRYQELQKQQRLIEQLDIEPMTRLYNRKAFDRNMQEIISHCMKTEYNPPKCFWLFILDLDYFKQVNDTYGHLNGDKVLLAVASTLKNIIGNRGRVYRYGGEEFAVLTELFTEQQVQKLGENVREKVEQLKFDFDSEKQITISIGITPYKADYTSEKWIDVTDAALYLAKRNGRNQVKIIQ